MPPAYTGLVGELPWFFPLLSFVAGAVIGSFLNVVIVRLPAGESVVRPRSHCACGQPIAWRDNIPILSWLILRGKARCCGRPISARYPLVEALAALLFLVCSRRFEPPVMICGWVFLSALIVATFIDADTLLLPDALTIGLAGAGLFLSLLVPALHGEHSGFMALDSLRSAEDAIVGLLVGSGLLVWVAAIGEAALKKEAVGFGDVKLIGAIGTFCGWHGAVFAVFGGAVAGTLWLLLAILARKSAKPVRFGTQLPFGPMLAFAAAAYFLFLHAPVDAWFTSVSGLF